MKTPALVIGLLLAAIGLNPSASASAVTPTYTVVDLGSSYRLRTDPDGAAYGVTTLDGTRTYAFDKASDLPIYQYIPSGSPGGGFTVYTLEDGSQKAGYTYGLLGGTGPGINVPTSMPFGGGWYNQAGISPVSDLNMQGEIVGQSLIANATQFPYTYAAFSNPTGQSHDSSLNAAVVDNLNNYIAGNLGVYLAAGMQVDDQGRITAQGSLDGQEQDFLLIPAGLPGDPIPAPEPSTLALLAVASAGLAIRRFSGRRSDR